MDINVFPEYYEGELAGAGIEIYGRFTDEHKSRMFLGLDGTVMLYYDKLDSDGKNVCGSWVNPLIWARGDLAIGMICCMDIQRPEIWNGTREALLAKLCEHKVLAICGYMGPQWLSNDPLSFWQRGIYVVCSNGQKGGTRSFIATPEGRKISGAQYEIGGDHIIRLCGSNRSGA